MNKEELVDTIARKEISRKEIRIFSSSRDKLFNPLNRNDPHHRDIIQSIIKYLSNKRLSITYSYFDWYRIAFAIANSFTYELGEKYFLGLSKMDTDKYNEIEAKNMLDYAYVNQKGEIKFPTIIYLAIQKGYKIKKS